MQRTALRAAADAERQAATINIRVNRMCRPAELLVSFLVLAGGVCLWAQSATTWRDPSPHKAQLVTVDENMQLEVLDWGRSGQPIVLLAGSGNTAHVFADGGELVRQNSASDRPGSPGGADMAARCRR